MKRHHTKNPLVQKVNILFKLVAIHHIAQQYDK